VEETQEDDTMADTDKDEQTAFNKKEKKHKLTKYCELIVR
jgi:hypothetical protein